MATFAAETALKPGSNGSYVGEIFPGWDVLGNANGGYLMSILGRAALLESGRPDIVSLSAHFLAPGRPGPITATTASLKDGKRFATTRVDLSGPDRPLLSGTVITGDLTMGEGPELIGRQMPDMPAPLDCPLTEPDPSGLFPPPFMSKIEQRLHPDDFGGATKAPRIRGWFRLLDGEPIDTPAAVLASDFLPPTVFNTDLPVGWVPTVQMTVHFRRRPVSDWLLVDTVTNFVQNGTFEIDADIYDDSGELVAQARQLLLIARA